MTDSVTFFVPGRPFSKRRPRFGKGRTYTDPETVAAEQAVRWYARRAWDLTGLSAPFAGPVGLSCVFVFERAKRSKAAAGDWHVFAPDGDNLLKLASDALNPHPEWHGAWLDDAQVCRLSAEKRWARDGEIEGTTILVRAL